MKLYQQADNFTVFNGWYGNCDTECNTLNLNNVGFEPISAIYEFPNNGVGIKSFTGSEYSFLNAFDELICGKAYLIILKPGYGFVEIPNFTLSFAEEKNSLGMISTDCSFEGSPGGDTPTPQSQSGTIFVPMEQDDALSSSKSTFSTKLGVENYEKCSQKCDSHSLSHSMAKSTTGAEHIYEKQVKIKIRSWQNDGYQEDLVLEAQNDVYHKSGMYLRDGEPYMIVIRVDNKEERYLFIATADEQDDGTLNINTNGNAVTNLKFLALDYGRYKSEILYLIALKPEEEYNDLYERRENYYMGDANESGSVIVMPGSPFYHCNHNSTTYRFNTHYASLSGIEPEPEDPTPTPKQVGCPEDAKQCPDGSVVVRNPDNNCEFFPCPEATPTPKSIGCPKDIKQCPDGTMVGRNPDDDCNFYPCKEVDCVNGYCEFNEETLNYYQAQFKQKSYKRYSFNFRWNCFCHPDFVRNVRITVENDKIVKIINVLDGQEIANKEVATYYTLNGLFDFIKEAKLEKNADKITFRFNGEHFYMESAGIDYIFLAIDDELGFFVSDFEVDYNYIPTPKPEFEIKDFEGIIADFENTPIDDPSRVNLSLEGKIAYMNLEGGFFGITDTNGNKYVPVNLQNEILNTEKRYIKITKGFKKQNQVSIWMWGTLIYCEEWEIIDDDTPYPQPGVIEPLPVEPFVQSNAFLEYTGDEADRESREVLGGDDGNTAMYCRVSALIENNTGTPELIVRSNGVPNYTPKVGDTKIVGSWQDELSVSSDGNPNTIGEQDYIFTIPLIDVTQNPVKSEADDYEKIVATGLGPIGISSNGVPLFNPWHNNQNDYLSASRDAMTFATFSSCCGHPSGAGPGRTGAGPYHYHKYPTCIAGNRGLSPTSDIIEEEDMADVIDEKLKKKGPSAHSPILGYMLDGYPVYGPVGTTSSVFTENTSCKILRSSYVLNGENYEYSKGSGDLDKCNAIYSATPEYPNGCYHYVLSIDSNEDGTVKRTENPLYIQRSRDTDEVKYMITPMYPYTTVYFRGSEFGNFRNGDESTSIDPNDDPCAGYGVSWGPGIGPKPEGCNQQPPPM